MTRLTAVPDVPSTGTDPVGILKRPVWILAAQAGVIATLVIGAGTLGAQRPKVVMLVLLACLVPTLAFGPTRLLNRVMVSAPLAGLLTWWVASYLWTNNVYGWWLDTQFTLPLVLMLVALVGVLPDHEFRSALVGGCYIAIAYTVLMIVVHPGLATINPDGAPGWRGGFGHKNTMAPFMVLAVLILAALARPSLQRRVAIGTALVLIVMSQSTTALAAGIVVLTAGLLLRRLGSSSVPVRATLTVGTLFTAVVVGSLSTTLLAAGLGIRGKDATLSRRTEIWTGVTRAIDQRPWQGYGVGGVWSNPSVDPGLSINRGLGFTVFHSHNGYLEILLLLGVAGFILFLWLAFSTLRLGWLLLRDDPPMAILIVGFVLLMLMLSVSEITVFGVWLALLAALHCSALRAHRRRT